ncbi:hypothetical protein TUSST3_63280 [Streptomyces sp. TUS-ST3]|nr:hypothetical protein TUSST3_63280 [Streptomyces sp. TUS-ST3]
MALSRSQAEAASGAAVPVLPTPVGVYVTGSGSADVRWLNGSGKVSGASDSADRPVSRG